MGNENLTELFGTNVFNDKVMRERLPKRVYKELKQITRTGKGLDSSIAEIVANAMKDWAIEKGATHYTHWFQPMTGVTAEKHEAFLTPTGEGNAITEFSGKELIKGESDASSFPSGGLRATFEARGYTAWDCTSPAFVKVNSNSVTLCIPTAFCSYTGEALDKKTPLLRSIDAINTQALRVLRLFGDNETKNIVTSLGPEQEYFLIDRAMYKKRKDIIFTGRTLFGASAPKGQELEDHYYGSIRENISNYMTELNKVLWELGIGAKTQHNEVAPCQHELAPLYTDTNSATDHNQLIMECMKKTAEHFNLYCLLHEKPFAGVNGSGKHVNWSISTDGGENLLEPGKKPHENLKFLLFLVAIIKAVDKHGDLLRVSASNHGNDHRLGAQEAPPAIVSVFLGEQLQDILEQIEQGELTSSIVGERMESGAKALAGFQKDATDRNRTSPFAFTGNKFEFRMLGSSASVACSNYIINTIVSESLDEFATELEKADDFNKTLMEIIKRTVREHKRVVFNGNGYSQEWVEEAKRRGLPNVECTVEAIESLKSPKAVALFSKYGVLSELECCARAEILYEEYAKQINIEARTMVEMVTKEIRPAVIKYAKDLADSARSVIEMGGDGTIIVKNLKEVTALLTEMESKLEQLQGKLVSVKAIEDIKEQAFAYRKEVFFAMEGLRKPADQLEMIIGKDYWPFPTYGDLLFYV